MTESELTLTDEQKEKSCFDCEHHWTCIHHNGVNLIIGKIADVNAPSWPSVYMETMQFIYKLCVHKKDKELEEELEEELENE